MFTIYNPRNHVLSWCFHGPIDLNASISGIEKGPFWGKTSQPSSKRTMLRRPQNSGNWLLKGRLIGLYRFDTSKLHLSLGYLSIAMEKSSCLTGKWSINEPFCTTMFTLWNYRRIMCCLLMGFLWDRLEHIELRTVVTLYATDSWVSRSFHTLYTCVVLMKPSLLQFLHALLCNV